MMDLTPLAKSIESYLEETCDKVDAIEEIDTDGAAWRFVVDKGTVGFISCEDNEDDLDIPTVSTAIYLADVTKADKPFLFRLLEANGTFLDAHFTVQEVDSTRMLFIEQRVKADGYDPEDFKPCVDHLIAQYALFMEEDQEEA